MTRNNPPNPFQILDIRFKIWNGTDMIWSINDCNKHIKTILPTALFLVLLLLVSVQTFGQSIYTTHFFKENIRPIDKPNQSLLKEWEVSYRVDIWFIEPELQNELAKDSTIQVEKDIKNQKCYVTLKLISAGTREEVERDAIDRIPDIRKLVEGKLEYARKNIKSTRK